MKIKFTKSVPCFIANQNSKQHVRNVFGVVVFLLSFLTISYSQSLGINTTGAAANSKATGFPVRCIK